MICPCCNGRGEVDNPAYDRYSPVEAYLNNIPSMKKCRSCNGSGFVIGNAIDAIKKLQNAIDNKRGLTLRETKELLVFIRNKV